LFPQVCTRECWEQISRREQKQPIRVFSARRQKAISDWFLIYSPSNEIGLRTSLTRRCSQQMENKVIAGQWKKPPQALPCPDAAQPHAASSPWRRAAHRCCARARNCILLTTTETVPATRKYPFGGSLHPIGKIRVCICIAIIKLLVPTGTLRKSHCGHTRDLASRSAPHFQRSEYQQLVTTPTTARPSI